MPQKHRVLYGIAVIGLVAVWGGAAITRASDPPSSQEIAFAQEVSDLMVNELVAALFTEFDETTPANVEHGKQAISLIFNDLNRNMRLIGSFAPLLGGRNDRFAWHKRAESPSRRPLHLCIRAECSTAAAH
ncbi:MAG: hypothetical protein ACRD8O_15315 [Bryobacteraceae bacterium]